MTDFDYIRESRPFSGSAFIIDSLCVAYGLEAMTTVEPDVASFEADVAAVATDVHPVMANFHPVMADVTTAIETAFGLGCNGEEQAGCKEHCYFLFHNIQF